MRPARGGSRSRGGNDPAHKRLGNWDKKGVPEFVGQQEQTSLQGQGEGQAAATAGGLCFFHANPDKAAELGRIGGRKNRHGAGDNADPLPTLDTVQAVRDMVSRLVADVYAGKLNPRIAAGLAPLLNLQMRAIETSDMERRIADLEKRSMPELVLGNLPSFMTNKSHRPATEWPAEASSTGPEKSDA